MEIEQKEYQRMCYPLPEDRISKLICGLLWVLASVKRT